MRHNVLIVRRVGLAIGFALVALLAPVGSHGASTDALGRHEFVLGRSLDGRPIVVTEVGDFDATRRALVVGCIHGNEPAGIAVADWLIHSALPRELDLWVVPDLNPDGVAAGTRGNDNGVDLNRNFPWRWQRLSGLFDSGPRPLSEPESRIAFRLVRRLRPQVSIWFHQHLGVVDESGGKLAVERHFAAFAQLPLRRLVREPGSVVGWENHVLPGGTAFVVELPAGSLPPTAVRRDAHAVIDAAV